MPYNHLNKYAICPKKSFIRPWDNLWSFVDKTLEKSFFIFYPQNVHTYAHALSDTIPTPFITG